MLSDVPTGEDDPLTTILKDLRLEGAIHSRAQLTARWALQASERPFATFFAVTQGDAVIEMEALDAPVRLGAGEVAIRPQGDAALLKDAPSTSDRRAVDIAEVTGGCPLQPSHEARHGGGGAETTLIVGNYEYDSATDGHPFFDALPPLLHVGDGQDDLASWLETTLGVIETEMAAPRPGSELATGRLTEVLLIRSIRAFVDDLPAGRRGGLEPDDWLRAIADPHVGRALTAMHDDPARSWTVEALAGEALLSRTAFAERFNRLVGEPPIEHLTRLRMHRARQVLLDSDRTVGEAAAAAGYQSVSSFSKAFKRWSDMPPGAFQKSNAEDRRS
ncbi:AraC family transcriptional regulator [Salinibacter altiplanensis]|uniref:AraC family transcriptional regulator n=1 Tax=Salinibacter altiplanensis TaxID=1803181 RepID=UPI00131A06EB|nr:AraC family transcriptional regulator [Salinibacter altiplanensis]